MKRLEIVINGTAYPCSPTMGAMLRFKQETGREITQIDPKSFTDLCTYLWCCVVSASRREGLDFGMSLMEFADGITPEEMAGWTQAVAGERARDAEGAEGADSEKKRP
ncbi:MAG: hypothetical protein NC043_07080 [Muribaculaceae bacterium]|nr:hypothetical protein [Muribaculaceae bacterium]